MSPPDPFRAAAKAFVDAARVPGRPVVWTERQVMKTLRSRLESAAPESSARPGESAGPTDDSLGARMRGLLDRALQQTAAGGTTDLYQALLEQLVPDEARIISALSDGSAATVIHVCGRTRTGSAGEPVLENASLVGRTANLTLPHLTPVYVGHLLSLGLVVIGPEDPQLKADYEILSADDAVRAAIKEASLGPVPPRLARHTLRLSQLGMDLWAACSAAATPLDEEGGSA